ncbi:MAG TPA: hypothetical protein VFZ91_00165 [Allosphingosinicella sp.]
MLSAILATSIICACSKVEESAEELKRFPEPIEIYDDSADKGSKPPAKAAGPETSRRLLPEFECVAGAMPEAGLTGERADRPDDNGRQMVVMVYDPAHISIFGFEAKGLERFQEATGRAGVASYVAADKATVVRSILGRSPGSVSTDGTVVSGPSLAGPISLREASGEGGEDLTRIECVPADQGGEE